MSLPPYTGTVELIAYSEHVKKQLGSGVRMDNRTFDEMRIPNVSRGVDTKLSASQGMGLLSSVLYTDNCGSTSIVCAVHAVFGPPHPQTPDEGRLNVFVRAPFLQEGGGFTSVGGHSNAAITNGLADYPLRQVEGYVRGVLESCLDLRQLCVSAGEACWVLTVNLTFLNLDGGLRTAALHAAVATLQGVVLPRAQLPNGVVVEQKQVHLSCVPVACTFGVLARETVRLLVDTTAAEEMVCDGTITVAVDAAGNLVNLYQLGKYPLTIQTLLSAMQTLGPLSKCIRERLLEHDQN